MFLPLYSLPMLFVILRIPPPLYCGSCTKPCLCSALENGGLNSTGMMMNPYTLLGNMSGMSGMNPFSGLPGGMSGSSMQSMNANMISSLYMQGGLNRGFPRMMEQVGNRGL